MIISSIEALFSLFGLVRFFHWLRFGLVEIRRDDCSVEWIWQVKLAAMLGQARAKVVFYVRLLSDFTIDQMLILRQTLSFDSVCGKGGKVD